MSWPLVVWCYCRLGSFYKMTNFFLLSFWRRSSLTIFLFRIVHWPKPKQPFAKKGNCTQFKNQLLIFKCYVKIELFPFKKGLFRPRALYAVLELRSLPLTFWGFQVGSCAHSFLEFFFFRGRAMTFYTNFLQLLFFDPTK